MIIKAQMQTLGDKTVINGLRLYASDGYRLLIMVGGVGCVCGDFSQTVNRTSARNGYPVTRFITRYPGT